MLNYFWEGESAFFYLLWVIISISKLTTTHLACEYVSPNAETHLAWQILYPNKKMIWHDKFWVQMQNTFDMTNSISKFEHGDLPARIWCALCIMEFSNDVCPVVYWHLTENREWPGNVRWWKGGGYKWICLIQTNCSWNSCIVSWLPWNYSEQLSDQQKPTYTWFSNWGKRYQLFRVYSREMIKIFGEGTRHLVHEGSIGRPRFFCHLKSICNHVPLPWILTTLWDTGTSPDTKIYIATA